MSRRSSHVSRRAVLSGLGSITVGLPLLESMGHAAGGLRHGGAPQHGGLPPKRVVFFVTKNGFDPATVWPTGSEYNFSLGEMMQPLEPYKDRMILFRGIDNMAAMATGVNGHTDGIRCMLTGRAAANNENSDYTAGGGISLDQFIANQISDGVKLKSVELQTGAWSTTYPNWTSFAAAGQPVPFEHEPDVLWDRIFAKVNPSGGPDPAMLQLKANRKSVLDAVMEQYTTVNAGLSTADQARLATHLEMVRELEMRIANTQPPQNCTVPTQPPSDANHQGDDDVGTDIIAHALGCDLVRVATFAIRNSGYGFLGVTGSYHDDHLHNVVGSASAQQIVKTVKHWECQRLVNFLDRLASIPEGTGTVLDNTLVVWTDEFCHGYSHQHHEVPYTLISGSDRFFPMGRYIEYASPRANNELWLSVRDAMGAVGAFGDPQFGNAPLPNL
ncbi:MAG: DUF1552 domain-containing protein [Myxococcota bacterium]